MRLSQYFKERFFNVLSGNAGVVGIVLGLGFLLLQLLIFLAVFGAAVKGVSTAFGIGAFFGGVIVWALIFWIPFGEIAAFGFLAYGIYALVTG